MTVEEFHRQYEAWGTDDRMRAELERGAVSVPGEVVIVAGFPLGNRREWTLRLESDRAELSSEVIVL